jgi:hypothetical protein
MSDKHLLAGGFGFPLGFALSTLVVLGSAAVGAFAHPVAVLVALAVTTFVVSATTTLRAALGVALVSWGLYAGFVVGELGQLTFNSQTVTAAGVLLAAALVAVGVVAVGHHLREPVRFAPPVRG